MTTIQEEPSYLAFARANVRDGLATSTSVVRELLARIDRDAAALKAAAEKEAEPLEYEWGTGGPHGYVNQEYTERDARVDAKLSSRVLFRRIAPGPWERAE